MITQRRHVCDLTNLASYDTGSDIICHATGRINHAEAERVSSRNHLQRLYKPVSDPCVRQILPNEAKLINLELAQLVMPYHLAAVFL